WTARARDLAEHRITIRIDVREWKSDVRHPGNVLSARIGEVTPTQLPRTFEEVAHRRSAREAIDVVHSPAEPVGERRGKERRIGHPAGNDDIRAGPQRGQQGLDADIGVRRYDGRI